MNEPLDLLVIGGGASGASVTYEAARRGLSVALLEGSDLSCGTSCRSTKLLHGGVRYLELAFKTADPAQLRLVREALLERGHWLRHAPFLAQRLELALPTATTSSMRSWALTSPSKMWARALALSKSNAARRSITASR